MNTNSDPSLALATIEQRDSLLQCLRKTLQQSRQLDAPGPHGGGEDEANYALPWLLLHLLCGDEAVAEHAHGLYQDLERWVQTNGVDGYEADAEAHHGTEPFLLFLPRYAHLFDSAAARQLMTGAADFIVGRKAGAPRWYDAERDVFVSWDLGARHADRDSKHRLETGDHWRFLHLALAAHDCSGDAAYAEWALRYARARAQRILAAADPLPACWNLDGTARSFAGEKRTHTITDDPLTGIEALLASGGIHALADCYAISPDPLYHDAAKRVADHLLEQLDDPYCDPAAATLRRFRLGFADASFDAAIVHRSGSWSLAEEPEYLVLPPRAQREVHGPGVGRRLDMQRWYVADHAGALHATVTICPAAATLAWDVTGQPRFALHALRVARQRAWVAQRGLRSGREHADKGCSIASVLCGHGRNWGTGAATGCLQPLLCGGDVRCLRHAPALSVQAPANVLALVRSHIGSTELHCWNTGDLAQDLRYTDAAGLHVVPIPAQGFTVAGR